MPAKLPRGLAPAAVLQPVKEGFVSEKITHSPFFPSIFLLFKGFSSLFLLGVAQNMLKNLMHTLTNSDKVELFINR